MYKKFTLFFLFVAFIGMQVRAQAPTVAAPVPAKASEDVISVYSDSYTSVYSDLSGSWSDSEHTELQVGSDNFVEYTAGGAGNQKASIDLSPFPNCTNMEYLHIDYYVNDASTVLLFGVYSGGDSPFYNMSSDGGGMVAGSWQSVDIPLTHYNTITLDNVAWVRIEAGAPASTVYIDNVYFWKEPTAAGSDASLSDLTVDGTTISGFDPLIKDYVVFQESTTVPTVAATTTDASATTSITAATSVPGYTSIEVTSANTTVTETYKVYFTGAAADPTHEAADVLSVYSDVYTSIYTDLNPNWGQGTAVTEFQLGSNNILEYATLNYQGMIYTSSDVSNMEYLHIDYYTVDATELKLSLIGAGENPYDIAATDGITVGSWTGIDIPLTHYTAVDLSQVVQFKTEGNKTVYVDNLYFWKNPTASGKDVTLSDLTIDGTTIEGFAPAKENYTLDYVAGTTTVPTVVATTTDASATAVVTPAASMPGSTTIAVTSADGTESATYTINFTTSIPATAAPAPTKAAEDVFSVYSDAYTSIATNLNPGWGQSTVFSEVDFGGDNALKYAGLDYQGTEYTSTDVSGMDFVHFDYYTSDATALQFFLIAGGENAYNVATEEGITLDQWVGIDIPLSFYADAGRDLTTAFQFKIVGDGSFYFDNMYFWKNPSGSGKDVTLSDLTIDGTTIDGFESSKTLYNIDMAVGTTTVPTVDVSTTDPNATYVVTPAASIPGTTSIFVTSDDETVTATYEVKFTATLPGSAAPTPTQAEVDVISVFSDAYTNLNGNLNPNWSQTTVVSEVLIDGNNTLKYAGLDYQGTEYTNSDVSKMEYLHFDYFTSNATALQFFLIAGGENAYDVATSEDGIILDQWVSIDIPMSFFADAGRDLTAAYQFKVVGNGTVYLDNMFFWKEPTADLKLTTLSDLTVDGTTIAEFSPTKLVYDIDMTVGTTTVPTVEATTTNVNATAVVTPATGIPGSTTILVTSEDQTETETYTINFTATIPATAAPTPTQAAENVISVYSDAYTSIATDINPYWNQVTLVTEFQIEGNNTLKYANLNYQGMEYHETDVSEMDFLHVDYFTGDATALEVFLIAGGENAYNVATTDGITLDQWVSVDIPMSVYADAGRDLTAAYQFKIVGDGNIYFDNFYFYKVPYNPDTDATLSDLTVDGSTIADFSASTLTYTYEVPVGTTTVPTVDATTTNENASYVVNPATEIPGSTTVVVTAEDGSTTETYTINFIVDPDGIEKAELANYSVYPNPASDIVYVKAAANFESLEIIDITGKTVIRSMPGTDTESLDVSSLNEGIYIVKVYINGEVGTSKLIVK